MSTTSTWYLCIGHPAWPDPLHKPTIEEASAWYHEHIGRFPDLRIVEVTERRTPKAPLPPATKEQR